MPLSEHEQRLLEQIEQGLYAEDPKFAASVRRARVRRGGSRRRLVFAVLGAALGLGVILIAMATKLYAVSILVVFLCLAALYESWSLPLSVLLVIPLGVVGFVIIVASCSYGLLGLGAQNRGPLGVVGSDGTTGRSSKRSDGGLKDRMEGRIRRRFDEE